jgi:hypothetical protein
MFKKGKSMPLRYQTRGIRLERLYADYRQAAALLLHDLVWSEDLEAIRLDLAELIRMQSDLGVYPASLTRIVQNLISFDNDLTV